MNKSQHPSATKFTTLLLRSFFFSLLTFGILLTVSPFNSLIIIQNAKAATVSNYKFLGDAYGRGGIQKTLVGPGQSASHQLFYLTYTYVNNTLDLVTIDPNTGKYQAYTSPVSSEQAAWALTNGPDNNIYIGTLPNAHLLQFNTSSQKLIDLGHVPADPRTGQIQTYIWGLTTSTYNQTIYGCTYPSADLVSYNPLSSHPQIVNIGSMDTTGQEQYGHVCVADSQATAPYLYIGLGSVHNQVAAYNIATHMITTRINQNTAGFGAVYRGADGMVYGSVMNGSTKESYRLSYGQATPTATPSYPAPPNMLKDGGYINVNDTATTISYPNGSQVTRSYPYGYAGKKLSIYRMGSGPDGKIYGGTALPYDFFSYDPTHAGNGVQMIGQVGGGQPYALQTYQGQLYISAYAATPLSSYKPGQSFSQSNPGSVSTTVLPTDLRTRSITGTSGNMLYAGAIASYGKLTGPLMVWNTQSAGNVQTYYPIANQSISALVTTTQTCQGSSSACLVGGTTIYGGTGTTPATTSAQIFTWDITHQRVLHSYPLSGASTGQTTIIAMVNNPSNGYVYGIAASSRGNYLFIFDPGSGRFLNPGHLLPLSSGVVYNSLSIYQGNLWGESESGFFSIKLNNIEQLTLQKSPVSLSAGFAREGNVFYGSSNSGLWSYTIS